MIDVMDTHHGLPHPIRRGHVYDDCLALYTNKLEQILKEFPFRIRYEGEKAIDTGGVSRDMFSAFWECAYPKQFDGGNVLVPASHPGVDMETMVLLGTILSHGFLSCGYLPIRLAFPVICFSVLGPCQVPDQVVMECFVDYISTYEGNVLKEALEETNPAFSDKAEEILIDTLSCFGCRESPTPKNLRRLLKTIAQHEFLVKPMAGLQAIHSGVPEAHKGFWSKYTVEELLQLYLELNASPAAVLCRIEEPEQTNSAKSRVFGFLRQLVGSMKNTEIRRFLRFVTGSSVLIDKSIKVSFNNLHGAARRPISHTCSCTLELSTSYYTYLDFEQEFLAVLSSDEAWVMDSV